MNKMNVLNILNGQSMYNYFKKNQLDKGGVYIPFNEAMCVGEVSPNIFSNEFIKLRCDTHSVTIQKYTEHTLKPLQKLFNNEFSHIVLWFDDDMFCQINFLTILGYLDQINYNNGIVFNLVREKFKVNQCIKLSSQGFKDIYDKVMIKRVMPENIELPIMKNGIKLYLECLKEENEIISYIKKYKHLSNELLLIKLFKKFPQYGLGDTQYFQLIEKYRK